MEHPGASPSPIQGKPIIYGTVHGAVGKHNALGLVYLPNVLSGDCILRGKHVQMKSTEVLNPRCGFITCALV